MPGRVGSGVCVLCTYGWSSEVCTAPNCARTPVWSVKRIFCSKRTCGIQSHRLPAPARGANPTRSRLELGGLHGAELRAYAGLVREADLLLEAHLRNPEPQVACAGQRRELHLRQRGGLARREDGALHARHDATVCPIDLDLARAQPESQIQRRAGAAREVHVDVAVYFAAQESLRPGVVQAEGGLIEGGAAAGQVSGPGEQGVLLSAAPFGVQEAVEESHAGDPDGEALGSLHLALREFFDAALVHGDFLVERRRGFGRLAAGFRQFLAQLADLFGQRLVLPFQAVQALYDLPKIDLPEIGGSSLSRKDAWRQESDQHAPRVATGNDRQTLHREVAPV